MGLCAGMPMGLAVPWLSSLTSMPACGSRRVLPASGSLVRFRGMVQDIFDPEMYLWRFGKHGDQTAVGRDELTEAEASTLFAPGGTMSMDANSSGAILGERLPVYLVTIPGQTQWARSETGDTGMNINGGSSASFSELNGNGSSRIGKRGLERDESSSETLNDSIDEGCTRGAAQGGIERKRVRHGGALVEPSVTPILDPNLPIISEVAHGSMAVIAKLYLNCGMPSAELNEILEVIGIVSYPQVYDGDGEPQGTEGLFRDGREPPGHVVPRIHVLHVYKGETPLSFHPLSGLLLGSAISGAIDELRGALPAIRSMLIDHLRQALRGDQLAAEYLLIAILSRVEGRSSNVAMGRFSLNLVIPDFMSFQEVRSCLEELLPRVTTIPLDIATLNATTLTPHKDYDANRLRATPLQQPDGACLLVDETVLSAGQLNEKGIRNVEALKTLFSSSIVHYDFKFYQTSMPWTGPTIVVSRGGRSLISQENVIRVQPIELNSGSAPRPAVFADDVLEKLRLAIVLLADGPWSYCISQEMSTEVETSFVQARQEAPQEITAEHLTQWLTVARLLARSHGESELYLHRWQETINSDRARRARERNRYPLHAGTGYNESVGYL